MLEYFAARPGEGYDFAHDEVYNGGIKYPRKATLRAHHPGTGELAGELSYYPPKRKGSPVTVERLGDSRKRGAGSALLNEMERRHPGSRVVWMDDLHEKNKPKPGDPDFNPNRDYGLPTDWDTHFPNLPGSIHRGIGIRLEQHEAREIHTGDRSAADQAKLLYKHVQAKGPIGMHWSADPVKPHQFAFRNALDVRTDIPVVLHAEVPERQHIETRPDVLRNKGVWPHDHRSGDAEVPVRKRKPVRLTGISWLPDAEHPEADENGWVHHTFPEPMQHFASQRGLIPQDSGDNLGADISEYFGGGHGGTAAGRRVAGRGKPRRSPEGGGGVPQPRAGGDPLGEDRQPGDSGELGAGSGGPRSVEFHPAARKDLGRLAKPEQRQIKDTINTLANGGPTQTHALTMNLKGWYSTKASRGHRIVHRTTDDGGIHIGYIGLHEYERAIRRLTVHDPHKHVRGDDGQYRSFRGAWGSSHGNSSMIAGASAHLMGIPGYHHDAEEYRSGTERERLALAHHALHVIHKSPGVDEPIYHGTKNPGAKKLWTGDEIRLPLTAATGMADMAQMYAGVRDEDPGTVMHFPKGTPFYPQSETSAADRKEYELDHRWDEAITAGHFKVADSYTDDKGLYHVHLAHHGTFNPHTKQWEPAVVVKSASRDELHPLPGQLYHVTTALDAVRGSGLKTRKELGQRHGHGLGGGRDDTISLTDHKETADHLLHSLHEYHDVLNGKITPDDLAEKARLGVGAKKPFHELLHGGNEYYERAKELEGDRVSVQAVHTLGDQPKGWEPDGEPIGRHHATGQPVHLQWTRKVVPQERTRARSELYKHFTWSRQFHGGHMNPLFIANDSVEFAKKDPSQFAILHVQPKPGATGIRMNDRTHGTDAGEWRALSGGDLDVTHHEQQGDIAPRTAARKGYIPHPDKVFWHGSPSGDMRGGAYGLHIGTHESARQALNARIGHPAEGHWDGTREYGKTLLAGHRTLQERGVYPTGYSMKGSAAEDHYPTEGATYSDGTPIAMDAKPNIFPVRIKGEMSNTEDSPHEDFKANGYMKAQISQGRARRGYFYTNVAEDVDSISAVVPNGDHLERLPQHEIEPGATHYRPGEKKASHPVPHERIFGPTKGSVDPRLFTADQLKPEVRQAVLERLERVLGPLVGYSWKEWSKVYLAGSEASEWYGNNDFDTLIGVDYDKARELEPPLADLDDAAISDAMNTGLKLSYNASPWKAPFGGEWDLTGYVNANSYDITRIKPYAAYNITDDVWAVRPPHLPDWSIDKFPEGPSLLAEAEGYASVIEAIDKMPEPFRTQQGRALWEHLHSDRSRAFSDEGEGWMDPGNAIEKALVEWGLWPKLIEMKFGPQKTAVSERRYSKGRMRLGDITMPGAGDLSPRPYTQKQLARDIKSNGITDPIAVRTDQHPETGEWTHYTINGMHRLHAGHMAGVHDAPVVVSHPADVEPPLIGREDATEQEFNDAYDIERSGRWAVKTASLPVEHVRVDKLWSHREWNHGRGEYSYDREGGGPYAPKHDAESWDTNAASVAEGGIQEPITLHYNPKQRSAYIGEGNHRLHWAREAGHETVPVRMWKTTEEMHPRYKLPGQAKIQPNEHGYFSGEFRPSDVLPEDWFASSQRTAGARGDLPNKLFIGLHQPHKMSSEKLAELDDHYKDWVDEVPSVEVDSEDPSELRYVHALDLGHPDESKRRLPVGFIRYHENHVPSSVGKPYLSIDNMAVHPDYQRRGIASAMQKKLADRYKGWHIDHGQRTGDGKAWAETYFGKQASNEGYGIQHRPRHDGDPLHALNLPDAYTRPQKYVWGGHEIAGEALAQVRQARNKPEHEVTIYRAAPKKSGGKINQGDWVTLSHGYAQDHADQRNPDPDADLDEQYLLVDPPGPEDHYHVYKARVPAKHVRNGGNDLMEWGYAGPDVQGGHSSECSSPHDLGDKTAASDDDYRMQHKPPNEQSGRPYHHYDGGEEGDHVRIYRSAPPHVDYFDTNTWATTNPEYAHVHGRHPTDPEKDWPVMSAEVPKRHVYWDENDENEVGYQGPRLEAHEMEQHHEDTGGLSPFSDYQPPPEEPEPEEYKPTKHERWGSHTLKLSPEDYRNVVARRGSHEAAKTVLKHLGPDVTWHHKDSQHGMLKVDDPSDHWYAENHAEMMLAQTHPAGGHEPGTAPLLGVTVHTKNGKTIDRVAIKPHLKYDDLPRGFYNGFHGLGLGRATQHPSLKKQAGLDLDMRTRKGKRQGISHTTISAHTGDAKVGHIRMINQGQEVDDLYVNPGVRGHGVAHSLMNEALRQFGHQTIRLHSSPFSRGKKDDGGLDQGQLTDFYAGHGFVPEEARGEGYMIRYPEKKQAGLDLSDYYDKDA